MEQQHQSTRGGATAIADSEAQVGFTDLILGNGPKAPQYGRVLSQSSSLKFYTEHAEYKRKVELCNSAQSISRPVLSIAQLLRKVHSVLPVAHVF